MKKTSWLPRLPETLAHGLHSVLRWPASFMQQLQKYGLHQPVVQIMTQQWRLATHEDCEVLALQGRSQVLVRDVLIGTDKAKKAEWMLARSVFPHSLLRGPERQLGQLKTRPLGRVLFRHPHMVREAFEFAELSPSRLEEDFHWASQKALWARRSIFRLRGKPLLLTEIFLPDLVDWLDRNPHILFG